MKLTALLLLMLLTLALQAQQPYEPVVFDSSDPVSGYYLALRPSGSIDGVLVLMGGFGDNPHNVFIESKLPVAAAANNFLTLVLSPGQKIYADAPTITRINQALYDSIQRFKLENKKFVIGGMSAGGTIALRYAEHCLENPTSFPIQPKAVFAVDSPVDLFDLWDYFDRELARNFSDVGMAEARFVQDAMAKDLGGTPTTNRESYLEHTPFYRMDRSKGNERFLLPVAVRSYHDADIAWQLENRRRSAYDMNFAAASELIARLMLQGHKRAELMMATGKGYRANGMRHPHSWSIVDETEFIEWMKTALRS